MATFNYARAVQTADRLIRKFGSDGALRRMANNYAAEPIKVARLNYDQRQIDGTRIKAEDVLFYVSTVGIGDITVDDRILFDGDDYEIVPPVRQLSPAGTNVYWEIQGRL